MPSIDKKKPFLLSSFLILALISFIVAGYEKIPEIKIGDSCSIDKNDSRVQTLKALYTTESSKDDKETGGATVIEVKISQRKGSDRIQENHNDSKKSSKDIKKKDGSNKDSVNSKNKTNTTDVIRVNFEENEVVGQGEGVRASGWLSATLSSLFLGINPSHITFTYSIGGKVDGPSAGSLLTLGTMSAILCDKFPEDVSISGTINPDGSIGPVGGLSQKLEAAAKNGIKTLLVPVGQVKDEGVDLIKRGQELNVAVKPVSNIYEAYNEALNKPLPQPNSTSKPSLSGLAKDKVNSAVKAWLAKYSDSRRKVASFDSIVRGFKELPDLIIASDKLWKESNNYLQQGSSNVALELAISSAQNSEIANQKGSIYQTYLDRGFEAALHQVDSSLAVKESRNALREKLKTQEPKTSSDLISLIDTYSNYVIANAYIDLADKGLDELKDEFKKENLKIEKLSSETKSKYILKLAYIAGFYAEAKIKLEIANTNLETYLGFGSLPAPKPEVLNGIAELLQRASESNLEAFNNIFIQDIAEHRNVRDDEVKNKLADNDWNYLLLRYMVDSFKHSDKDSSNDKSTNLSDVLSRLGSAQNAYALSSSLMSKYYSLDADLDDGLNVIDIKRKPALLKMIEFAESHSDALIGMSKDISLPSLYYSDNARVYRQNGTDQDKFNSLFYYWQSSILSQVLVNITGEYGSQVQKDLNDDKRNIGFLKEYKW